MLAYFIIHLFIGFIIGVFQKDQNIAMSIILLISIVWAFIYGLWAIACFVELSVGYALSRKMLNHE